MFNLFRVRQQPTEPARKPDALNATATKIALNLITDSQSARYNTEMAEMFLTAGIEDVAAEYQEQLRQWLASYQKTKQGS